jgi:dTDP-4-amino-4,6-dideoxygalactose transaminase
MAPLSNSNYPHLELPAWPAFEPDERQAALTVLASGRVNAWGGVECLAFEREWSDRLGCGPAIAMANGTLTLDAALAALGIGPGDEVIVSPRGYIACAGCVARRGARPVFVEVCLDSGNIDPDAIAAAIGPRTRALLPVHLAGWPAEMPRIVQIAARHGLAVIEDCAQAHGARIGGRCVGGFGTLASWSFCQDKIMTTGGEGGMLATSDEALWRRCWSLKEHGKSWTEAHREDHPHGFRWLVESHGSNYRMTEMQAAIGRCQLRKLDGWLEARRRNASILREALAPLPWLRMPWPEGGIEHAAYKVYAYLVPEALPRGLSREAILAALAAAGLPALTGACPEIYLERSMVPFRPPSRLPNAAMLGETSLMFPCHHTIDAATMERFAERLAAALIEVADKASRRAAACASA